MTDSTSTSEGTPYRMTYEATISCAFGVIRKFEALAVCRIIGHKWEEYRCNRCGVCAFHV